MGVIVKRDATGTHIFRWNVKETSILNQRFRQNLQTFTVIVSNNYRRTSGQNGFYHWRESIFIRMFLSKRGV
jgi:hypothetical protein